MRSCKPGKTTPKGLKYVGLGIVEICGTGSDDKNPLEALEACREDLPIEFLERLARRPERIILLQCSCRLGCDGKCDCSQSFQGCDQVDLWKKFVDKVIYTPVHLSSLMNTPSSSTSTQLSTLSQDCDELNIIPHCLCNGLPRLTSDIMSCFRPTNILYDDKDGGPPTSPLSPLSPPGIEKFSDLLDEENWTKSISFLSRLNPDKRLLCWDVVCLRKAWLEALKCFNELFLSDFDDVQNKEIFYLELANYVILNMAVTKTFGLLTTYLPKPSERVTEYLESKNPLKNLLARLALLHNDIPDYAQRGIVISAFCVDLANLAAKRLVRYKGRRFKRMKTLGEALIFATLLGGTCPGESSWNRMKRGGSCGSGGSGGGGASGSGIRSCGPSGGGGGGVGRVRQDRSGGHLNYAYDDRYFEVHGRELESFFSRVLGVEKMEMKEPIIRKAIYQIRAGQIYLISRKDEIEIHSEFNINNLSWKKDIFPNKITFDLGWARGGLREEVGEAVGEAAAAASTAADTTTSTAGATTPTSTASATTPTTTAASDPLYYYDRMEDLYHLQKPSSEGWKELLKTHPYIIDEIEMPREFENLIHLRNSEQDYQYARNAKIYFDRLPEDEGMLGQRKLISSTLLRYLPPHQFREPLRDCQYWILDKSQERKALDLNRVKEIITERIDKALIDDLVSPEDLRKYVLKFEQLLERFIPLSKGGHLVESDDHEASNTFKQLINELEYLEFKRLVDQRQLKTLNLLAAANARHYLLTGDGVEILTPLPEETRNS